MLQIGPDARKNAKQAAMSCNECPVPVFSSICFLRIRFRWIQMRGVPGLSDETDLRRQQSASAETRELLHEGSPKRRRQKQIGDA